MPRSTPSSPPNLGAAESNVRPAASSLESRLVLILILITLFLTSLPYLLGYFITPPGTVFIGTAYNIDDYCNYLSWLRQTMDGHFFFHNLFTTDLQTGRECNVFFWLLGRFAHFAQLTPQAALQVARVGGAIVLLPLIYRLYRVCLPVDVPARLTAFGFVCLGSGFGWLIWPQWQDKNLAGGPVDAWQPEAYTFLSLYTSALMTVSTVFIVGALYALLRGEQTGKWRYPIIAGVCGAVLGNIHSYDVLHLSAAWGVFLVVWTVFRRGRGVAKTWLRSIVALALTMPTTAYQYYLLRSDPVFRERAAVPTLSPAIWHYVLAYGLVFLLALMAVVMRHNVAPPAPASGGAGALVAPDGSVVETPAPPEAGAGGASLLFITCWAFAGLAVIYLPFAFQRKMLMGEHVPLCLLAGLGAVTLTRSLPLRSQNLALAALVLISAPSNLLFLVRDINHLETNRSETSQFPYLSSTLVATYQWIAANTPPESAVVGSPLLCASLPGYTDRTVWAGHWGETPHYATKFGEFVRFSDSQTPDDERLRFLRSTHAQYLLYANDVSAGYVTKSGEQRHFVDLVHSPPPYLKIVYTNKDYTLFHIVP